MRPSIYEHALINNIITMEEKTKKVLKSILGWIIYIVILAGLIYGIPKGLAYVLKTDYPMAAITSGSMWPALKRGDMVLVKGVHEKEEVHPPN